MRLMSGAAAWPSRSSGAARSPIRRRADGPSAPTGVSPTRIVACGARSSPESAARSSSWPFPATPPIPRTSPFFTSNETFFRVVPNGLADAAESPSTVSATSVPAPLARVGVWSV